MIGKIFTAVGAGLKLASEIAEKSKNRQLLDAGEAQANADNWKALNATIQEFKTAADAIESDADLRKLLRDEYTTD